MSGWSNRTWACPFYFNSTRLSVTCECGKISFPDSKTMNRYTKKYCAHHRQWQLCTLASELNKHYEEKDDE